MREWHDFSGARVFLRTFRTAMTISGAFGSYHVFHQAYLSEHTRTVISQTRLCKMMVSCYIYISSSSNCCGMKPTKREHLENLNLTPSFFRVIKKHNKHPPIPIPTALLRLSLSPRSNSLTTSSRPAKNPSPCSHDSKPQHISPSPPFTSFLVLKDKLLQYTHTIPTTQTLFLYFYYSNHNG